MSKPAPKTAPASPPAKKPAAAVPDAALLDRDGDDEAEAVAAPKATGFRRCLPSSKLGWTIAASLLIAILGGATTATILLTQAKPPPSPFNIVGPARAVDGGTLIVAGQTIRLQAIEAPPAALVCRDGGWEYKCGEESRKALEQLVGNRPIDCEPAYSAKGILHALCHSDQGIDVAGALVGAGWAVADLKRSSRYLPHQSKAQDQGLGLWRNNFAHPEQWRLAARGDTR
jgi:endonuclease YncB( thermonuclease family)